MTVHRRPQLLFAAAAFLIPACISIDANPIELTPVDSPTKNSHAAARRSESAKKTDFGIFRPGDSVATKPDTKNTTTVQRPPVNSRASLPQAPVAPPTPPVGAEVASDPGPFPLVQVKAQVPEPALLSAARAYIEGRPERAIEAIASLDKSNQDFILAMLPALVRGATADLLGDPVSVAVLADQLRMAATRLETRAALRIDTALFCDDFVKGFGRYVPRSENKPYRPNDKAQFYIEVRNLVSQPATGPRGEKYLTQARAIVEIRDAYNKLVPQLDPAGNGRHFDVWRFDEKRFTWTPLQDFHVVYTFPVPSQPGVYTITVQLSDAAGRRVAKSAPVQFLVAGP